MVFENAYILSVYLKGVLLCLSYPFLAISLLGQAIESRIISEAAWLSG